MSAPATKRVYTKQHSSVISSENATLLYSYLVNNVKWEEGVRSKNGFTRLAKACDPDGTTEIEKCVRGYIDFTLKSIGVENKFELLGVYLNYLQNGNQYVPSHSHPGATQLVISVGAPRTLKVGAKDYRLQSGDAILFGSSSHSVPVEPELKEGRISIATFMVSKDNLLQSM